jgi:AraC-like DNA-binding protein
MPRKLPELIPERRIWPAVAALARLCRARDFIRECAAEPISLDDCAAEAGLSPWHTLRFFRAAFGETPKEFQTRLRLDEAKRLLTVTNRTITEVCFDVGFSSLGSFSTLFRQHVGQSPREFRRHVHRWITVPGYPPWSLLPACFAVRYGNLNR